MAINTKAVKLRIKSVKNTKKITKAMQMIAAVKMRKAVENAISTRAYATLANDLLEHLGSQNFSHPLMKKRKVKNHLLIMISSNKGLCGSYNSNVLRTADKYVREHKDKETISILAVGSKSAQFAKRNELELVGLYEKLSENPAYEDVFPITSMIMDEYKAKKLDKVSIVYTNYVSGLVQNVQMRQILPLTKDVIKQMIEDLPEDRHKQVNPRDKTEELDLYDKVQLDEYEFEPTKQEVLKYVIPMLVEIQLFQALLESTASEHSSRMIAMKNASEAATDMIDALTLEFNKGRQAAITQEVSEIVSGANALG